MFVARRFVLKGRVQGVGFRVFAQDCARREGVSGWARNRADGAVEVFAEGEAESLARFEAKMRHGPPRARVDDIEIAEDVPMTQSDAFTIRS